MAEFKPLARKNDVVVQEFEGETLIYDLKANKAFALNQTSSMVWQLCDGKNTIGEIVIQLSIKLNDLVTEDLVLFSLEQLKKENLLESESVVISRFEDLSRREVIRKIALSSMVALPVILSLVAPKANAAVASFCPNVNCRCPNGSAICPGSTVPGFVNCNTSTGNNACDCNGPYGVPDSAGAGFKTGMCSF